MTTAELRMVAEIGCSLVNRGQRKEATQLLQQVDLAKEIQVEGDNQRQAALADVLFLDWMLKGGNDRLKQTASMATKAMWFSREAAMIAACCTLAIIQQGGHPSMVEAIKVAIRDHLESGDSTPGLQEVKRWLELTA